MPTKAEPICFWCAQFIWCDVYGVWRYGDDIMCNANPNGPHHIPR